MGLQVMQPRQTKDPPAVYQGLSTRGPDPFRELKLQQRRDGHKGRL
jgi:hypothetical protein